MSPPCQKEIQNFYFIFVVFLTISGTKLTHLNRFEGSVCGSWRKTTNSRVYPYAVFITGRITFFSVSRVDNHKLNQTAAGQRIPILWRDRCLESAIEPTNHYSVQRNHHTS